MLKIENLKILQNYLKTLPEDYEEFDMATYATYTDCDSKYAYIPPENAECGTIRCAVGHGPAAGLSCVTRGWDAYCVENFGAVIGCGDTSYDKDKDSSLMAFMFSGMWSEYDNTVTGAVKRMQVVIDHEGDYNKISADPRYYFPWE